MGNRQHLEWLLEGGTSWNRRRKDGPFEPDLSGFDLFEAFSEANNLIWKGNLHLNAIDFRHANLSNTNFGKNTRCNDADFSGANLSSANIVGMFVDRTRFTRANFTDAMLTGLCGTDTQFGEAVLDRANLDGARLPGAYCLAASLLDASIRNARLNGADLSKADLRRADLTSADFSDAQLHGVDLRAAKIADTYVARAQLEQAVVLTLPPDSSADEQRDPVYTSLRGCNGLTQRQLNTMIGDTGTYIPANLHCPPDWAPIAVQNSTRSTGPAWHRPLQWLRRPPQWVKGAALYAAIFSALLTLVGFILGKD